jgi:hypothetical protein
MEIIKFINTKNIIKYLIFSGIVYSLIKIIPTNPLTNKEKSILLIICLTALIGIDCIMPISENFTDEQKDNVVIMGKILNDMDKNKSVIDVIKERNNDYNTKLLNLTKIIKNSDFSNKLIENMVKEKLLSEKELKVLFINKGITKLQVETLLKNNIISQNMFDNITKEEREPIKPRKLNFDIKEEITKISKLLQEEQSTEIENELQDELKILEKQLENVQEENTITTEISQIKQETANKVNKIEENAEIKKDIRLLQIEEETERKINELKNQKGNNKIEEETIRELEKIKKIKELAKIEEETKKEIAKVKQESVKELEKKLELVDEEIKQEAINNLILAEEEIKVESKIVKNNYLGNNNSNIVVKSNNLENYKKKSNINEETILELEKKLKEKEIELLKKEESNKLEILKLEEQTKLKEQMALLKRKEEELKRKEMELVKKRKDYVSNEMKYNELPDEFFKPIGEGLEKWADDGSYSILNTDKWRVPMPRPPVCISSSRPCEPCPLATSGYPLNLKEWDSARKVSNININKDWVNN